MKRLECDESERLRGGGVGCVVVAIMESCPPWGMKKRGSGCLVRRVNLLVGVCVGCRRVITGVIQRVITQIEY